MNEERGALRQAIIDTAAELFKADVTPALLESAERGEFPQALWAEMAALGLPQASLSEQAGGLGSLRDAFALLRPAGYHALPLPLAETLLAGWLAEQAKLPLPEGPLSIAAGGKLRREGEGWTLTGTVRNVPWGRNAHLILLAENEAGGEALLALVPHGAASVGRGHNLAGEPRDTVGFAALPLGPDSVRPTTVDEAWMRHAGAAMRAAQMVGALEKALDQTVLHATERVQFGKPIGKFQAIQQMIAVLANHTAAAIMAADRALDALDGGDFAKLSAIAKLRVGEAAGDAGRSAHQVHGAMGFTQEHTLNYATRRLWSWRDEFGSEAHWAAWLGEAALSAGADRLWDFVGEAA
jgi:acyl-CoA dehydrogenase